MNKFQHTSSPAKVGRLCASRAMEALICLDFSIFGDIAEGPYLHFSMNLCYVLNTEEITQVRMKGCLMTCIKVNKKQSIISFKEKESA
jgi:hypothetical protein